MQTNTSPLIVHRRYSGHHHFSFFNIQKEEAVIMEDLFSEAIEIEEQEYPHDPSRIFFIYRVPEDKDVTKIRTYLKLVYNFETE